MSVIRLVGLEVANNGNLKLLGTTGELDSVYEFPGPITVGEPTDSGHAITLSYFNSHVGDHGSAGGDLSGSYPNPTVAKIQGRTIANTAPTDGYVLTWNASNNRWQPAASSGGGSPLTVAAYNNSTSVSNVTALKFDTAAGFTVTDLSGGVVKIGLGSFWHDLVITGQTTLVPTGEETLQFIAGTGINLATNATSTPKSITITASESDPVFGASAAHSITGTQVSHWDTAYGWGNHASAGYVTGTPWADTYLPLAGGTMDVDSSITFGTGATFRDHNGNKLMVLDTRYLKNDGEQDILKWSGDKLEFMRGATVADGKSITFANGSLLTKGTIDAGEGGSNGIALVCSVGYEMKWEAGRLYIMNDGGTSIRTVMHTFSDTPIADDDVTHGFVVGSRWVTDDNRIFTCTDQTEAAAVWNEVSNLTDAPSDGSSYARKDGTWSAVSGSGPQPSAFIYLTGGNYNATVDDMSGSVITDVNSSAYSKVNLPLLADAIAHGGSFKISCQREYNNNSHYVSVYANSDEWTSNTFRIGSQVLFSLYSTGIGDWLEIMPITIGGYNFWQVINFSGLWQDRD